MNTILAFVTIIFFATAITAQTCDNTGISQVFHSDITQDNGSLEGEITLYGDSAKTGVPALDFSGITLTDSTPANYGGIFFNAPVAFQGDGGFSAKFAMLAASGGTNGEGWEFIVANSNNLDFAPPPFGPGNPSAGQGGWSRTNAMVIEFDTLDSSGSEEQDNSGSGNHVAMYLNGAEICQASVTETFGDGNPHYVWIDFIGFSTTMQVRLSSANSRPEDPTVECGVDMWGSMSITENNHIGFGAYNPPSSDGAVHTLTESITFTDAYRPIDTDEECAYYTDCALRSQNSLCTTSNGDGTCSFDSCPPVYAWTIGGGSCCSFIERNSFRSTGSDGSIVDGGSTTCALQRVTVVQLASDDSLCNGGSSTLTDPPATTVPATTDAVTTV